MPKSKGKQYLVDGKSYTVAIAVKRARSEQATQLGLTVRAEYGFQSFCLIRGLSNWDYFKDYGTDRWENEKAISITPSAVCKLIRHALKLGWDPEMNKANGEIVVDNGLLNSLSR